MKVFANSDCTFTALFGHYLHFEAENGQWEEVDLNFRQQGPDFVMDRHALKVRVHGAGLEVTDQSTHKGIRWLTPGPPAVAGRRAAYQGDGLDWRYTTRKTGLKLEAHVAIPRDARTYDFSYHLLGGAAPLTVTPAGGLQGEGFSIPRAVAFGADGKHYPADAWRLLQGNRVAFDFDDSALPTEAFPYALDPTTVFDLGGPDVQSFNGGESGDDGMVQAGSSSYPPLAADYADESSSYIPIRRDGENDSYSVSNGLVRWDTSTLPEGAHVVAAELQVSLYTQTSGVWDASCPVNNADGRALTADWYSAWPIDPTDYSHSSQTNAIGGVWLDAIAASVSDRVEIPLDNTDGVSTTGYTGLRLHISGGQPSGANSVCFAAFDDTALPEPRLAVTFLPEPPVVIDASDSPDPVWGGDQLNFYVEFTDLEQGQNSRALICRSPWLDRQTGMCRSGEGIASGSLQNGSAGDCAPVPCRMVSAATWSWTGGGPFTYHAFVCNEYNVCSANSVERTGTVLNRTPSISSLSESPDPVSAGSQITFTVSSVDSWGDTAQAYICKSSTCAEGYWAFSSAARCPYSPPTTTCTTSATYTTGDLDVGTHTYYVYVCDFYMSCTGPSSETFTVSGSQGGGTSPLVPGPTHYDLFSDEQTSVGGAPDELNALGHGGPEHWRSYGQDNTANERIILIYDWTGFGAQWRQNARNPALDQWASSARIQFEVRENASVGTSCANLSEPNVPTDAILLCVSNVDPSIASGYAKPYELAGEPGHYLEGLAAVSLTGTASWNEKVVCHEVGHLLGLDHRLRTSVSCMNYDWKDSTPDGHDMNTVFDLHDHSP